DFAFIRADLFDIWRQAAEVNWQVDRPYLLYPNPWPKKKHLMRRYHGHPAFPSLLQLGTYFELRSNWIIYVKEFQQAVAHVLAIDEQITPISPTVYFSNFEKKYHSSGQQLFKFCFSRHTY
ncbi:MAG: SAM-dependent methyltransferase, partial [Calditrichaeota bacterium]